jgi:hypothetical protein
MLWTSVKEHGQEPHVWFRTYNQQSPKTMEVLIKCHVAHKTVVHYIYALELCNKDATAVTVRLAVVCHSQWTLLVCIT